MPLARRLHWARNRLEGRARRAGLLDARAGRLPVVSPMDLQPAAESYAESFLTELDRRWPGRVAAEVRRRRPWLEGALSHSNRHLSA